MKMKPEYEDLKKIAKTTNQPFQVIHNEVLQQLYQTYRIGNILQ
ncbi:TIGR00299 family protein, partial [Staphylococcus caprae]